MSKRETILVEKLWKETGGTLIEEFLAVKSTRNQGRRLIDGVIIKGGPHRKVKASEANIAGRKIVVIQAKASRLGMSVLGQALFSKELIRDFSPKSVETAAVCTKGDARLEPLAKEYGIIVRMYPVKS